MKVKDVYGYQVVDNIEDLLKDNVIKGFQKDYEGYRYYSPNIISIDTETQQVKDAKEVNYATIVSYQIAVNHKCMLMRDHDMFLRVIDALIKAMTFTVVINKQDRLVKLIIWCHNLTYDATFLENYMMGNMSNLFAVKAKISKFDYADRIEFRDSLMLTGLSLAGAIKQYVHDPKFQKTKDWDYTGKMRSTKTELTAEEEFYALADVVCLNEVIKGIMSLHSCTLAELPVSSTSFTRRTCMEETVFKPLTKPTDQQIEYRKLMETLKIPSVYCYKLMKDCYYGGVSDTNPIHADKYYTNVGDRDITSEYPFAMVSEKFPMSTPRLVPFEDITLDYLKDLIKDPNKGFMVRFHVYGLLAKTENPLPNVINDPINSKGVIKSGTRVYQADYMLCSFNDIDFKIFLDQYEFEDISFVCCYDYDMDYLPKQLVNLILKYYGDKTKLKGAKDPDDKVKYTLAKIIVNTVYGLMAQDPVMAQYEMDYETGFIIKQEVTGNYVEDMLRKYNKNKKRFTFYLWGIYVASYGHRYLYQGIRLVGNDLIACDTDSVKFIYGDHKEERIKAFEELNACIINKLKYVALVRNINSDLFMPVSNIDGERKPLGVWDPDDDNEYGHLVGLISKRPKCYLKVYDDNGTTRYKFTTAGITHKCVLAAIEKYISEDIYYDDEEMKYKKGCPYKNVVDAFKKNVCIGPHESGKLTHLYNHQQKEYTYVDDEGNNILINTKHAVYLDECSFSFNEKDVLERILEIVLGPKVFAKDSIID